MRNLRFWLVAGIASTTLMLLSLSPASALQYWISKAGEITPITELMVAPGEVFTLSVWAQHSPELVQAFEVPLGWTTAEAKGPAASPAPAKVVPHGGIPAAVTNELPYPGIIQKSQGGFEGTGTRPYGLWWVFLTLGTVDASAGVRLFDITFKNESLVPGDAPYPIVVWDFGSGRSWTALATLTGGATIPSTGTYTLNLVPVPEPGSLIALATGVAGLVGVALRRRRA